MLIRLTILFFSVGLGVAYAGEPDKKTLHEISHLFSFINSSPCEFYRNGKWYMASDAKDHIRKKYNYVLRKGIIQSAEDFIAYAASKSSRSGRNYMVKCGDDDPIPSASWLKTELSNHRSRAE
jgi:hypothetical protein